MPDSPTDGRLGVRVTFLGHATALIEMDGTRLLTDPVLRGRVAHLRREGRIDRDSVTNVDGVLISHAHMDHLDRPSLATIDARALMIAPAAAARLLVKRPVIQVSEGSLVEVGRLTVEVTHADHDGRLSPAEWESARQAAARECEAQKLQSGIERVSVVSQPADGRPFLISPLGPERMEKREQRMAWLYFALGLVCVWVCAWALRQASLGGAF